MNIILVPIYTQTYRRSMILFHIYRWIINMLIDEMNSTVFINFPWEENTHHWIFSEESRLRDVRLLCSVARNIHRCCSNLTVRRLICMTIYMQSITINHMHIYIYINLQCCIQHPSGGARAPFRRIRAQFHPGQSVRFGDSTQLLKRPLDPLEAGKDAMVKDTPQDPPGMIHPNS